MLGGVDAGKTHTVASIANTFHEQGLKVAVIDADVGQSDIGPPCSIGLGFLEKSIRTLSEVPLHSFYFVGNTSPRGCFFECLHGLSAQIKKAKEQNTDIIIIDSTGWIEGEEARKFKLLEIEKSEASLVIAIEKRNELDHITRCLYNVEMIRRSVSDEARSRTKEERRNLREKAFKRYFRAAKNIVLDISLFKWLPKEGTLLGLFNEVECVGIGILRKLDRFQDRAVIFTELEEKSIKWIKPGIIRLKVSNGRIRELTSFNTLPKIPSKKIGL